MITSTTRKLTRSQYAATLLGALAFVALAPATAHALPVNNGAGDGGCHYTDKDGYDIPIDDGQSVLVDGKTVSCSGGTITVSNTVKGGAAGVRPGLVDGKTVSCSGGTITVSLAPKAGGAGTVQQQGNPVLSPVTKTPKLPLLNQNVAIFVQQP